MGVITPLITGRGPPCGGVKSGTHFMLTLCVCFFQGSLRETPFGGIKQCQCIVILRDVPYNGAFFGLVIYNDHCFFFLRIGVVKTSFHTVDRKNTCTI